MAGAVGTHGAMGGLNIGFRSRYSELSTPKDDMSIKIIYLFIVLRR